MADVRPFKGIQYNPGSIGEIGKALAPPFDVISPEMQQRLHERHEANIVRLILADEAKAHKGASDRYDSARLYLEDWLRSGSLVQSDEPAIYLLAQDFDLEGAHTRWGFIATIKLEELDAGVVIPHEATLDKPKADRLKLITATQANLSPVFGCFFDTDGKIRNVLAGASDSPPQFEATDDDGVRSRLWKVTDPKRLEALHDVMTPHQLFIADGHHRYESALNYRNMMREKNPGVKDAPWERVMMYMTDFEDPNLLALPIHRVIKHLKGWTPEEFLTALRHSFEVEKVDIGLDEPESRKEFLKIMAQHSESETCIGLLMRGEPNPYHMRPRKEALQKLNGIPEPLRDLDIIQLHRLALENVLEIREKDLRDGEVIIYDHDVNNVFDTMQSGNWAAAFFLNRLKVKQIRRVCSAGLRMHQKSTYFYPKIPSGLVIHRLK